MRYILLLWLVVGQMGCAGSDSGSADTSITPVATDTSDTTDLYPVRVTVSSSITPACGAEVVLRGVAEQTECCIFGATHRVGEGTGNFRWGSYALLPSCTFIGFVDQDVLLTTGPNGGDVIYEIEVFSDSLVYSVSNYP